MNQQFNLCEAVLGSFAFLFIMSEEAIEDFVICKSCAHWGEDTRDKHVCTECNNSCKVQNPLTILCNLCGGSMCHPEAYNEQIPYGLHKAKVTGGYDSRHLFDMNTYIFSFCEECLRKLFISCKIKPEVYDTDFNGNCIEKYSWESDQKSYEYRLWEEAGGTHQAYMNGLCNLAKECPNKAKYTKFRYDEFTEECCCEDHKPVKEYSHTKWVRFIPHTLKVFL